MAVRYAPDFESPQAVRRTYVLEAQECERLRFPFPTFLPVDPGKTPEPDEPGLILVQFQSKVAQPCLKVLQVLPGFLLVLEPNDGVSRPGESHPEPLSEPYLSLSAHTAPAMEPRRAPSCQC